MTASVPPPPPPPEAEAEAGAFAWPLRPLLLAWVLGALLTLAVRLAGQSLLTGPCQGHTFLALTMPLLLGPGGLAFAAAQWNNRPRAMFGLGLVAASLLPALFLATYDIGGLRAVGCAGGYVMLSELGGQQVGEMTLRPGETRQLEGRIGGYQPATHPSSFALSAQTQHDSVVVTLPKAVVKAGEVFPVTVQALDTAPSNRFDWSVRADYQPTASAETLEGGANLNPVQAVGKVTVTVVRR